MSYDLLANVDQDDHADQAEEGLERRVVFYNGKVRLTLAAPDIQFENMRTFSYDKIAPYSQAIADALAAVDEDTTVAVPLHYHPTQDNPTWRMMFWWELELKARHRPALDEPFRELLTMVEKMVDSMNSDENSAPTLEGLRLPRIDGTTKNVSVYKLAGLHWSAKHLRLQAPLRWEAELRSLLLREINAIDTNAEHPAFRPVDFWYIWGAYRGLDEEIVDAMVEKMVDAIEHKTNPPELGHLLIEGLEMEQRLKKVRDKRTKKTWAQTASGGLSGRRAHVPSKLSQATTIPWADRSWRDGPKSAGAAIQRSTVDISSTTGFEDTPKTATAVPISILRRDSTVSSPTENELAKPQWPKEKGGAYTAPTGMAPPPVNTVKGTGRGKDKKYNTWGGKRAKGFDRGRGRASNDGGDGNGGGSGGAGINDWGWQ